MDSTHIIHGRSKAKGSRGYSLVELLIVLSMIILTITVALPTMIFLMQSNYSLGNITNMTKQSRQFVEQFGSDIRSVVTLAEGAEDQIVITVEDPNAIQQTITYTHNAFDNNVTRKVGNGSPVALANNIKSLKFRYYDSKDIETANYLDIKKVEVQMQLKQSVLHREQNLEYRSARFVLRNRATRVQE